MYIQAFPIASTNVFPMANSVNGGQLATEFNLRSRESVATDKEISYMVGPTYVHSPDDFKVSLMAGSAIEETRYPTSTSVLIIGKGRALINGHYVETLSDIQIDLPAAIAASGERISGTLVIGVRMLYSDIILSGSTMLSSEYAGSLEAEDTDTQMYKGIQIVILPESEFKLPIDSPDDESAVTAHLKLATFKYVNGAVNNNSLVQTPFSENGTTISADRIKQLDEFISGKYISIDGLQPNKIYTFAGKPIINDDNQVVTTGESTWTDSTDSIMVWDKDYTLMNPSTDPRPYKSVDNAQFIWNDAECRLDLVVPHKQIAGGIIDTENPSSIRYKFYPRVIPLPTADFSTGSCGVVDTQYRNAILSKFNEMDLRYLPKENSKQIAYVSQLNDDPTDSAAKLPSIQTDAYGRWLWRPYDYVYVGQDFTQVAASDTFRAPATLYMIIVSGAVFSPFTPSEPAVDARLLGYMNKEFDAYETYHSYASGVQIQQDASTFLQSISCYDAWPGDVVVAVLTHPDENDPSQIVVDTWYGTVSVVNEGYSDPIWVTNMIGLATEDAVGGFINVSDSDQGSGYVYRDPEGHLRVVDYERLISGTLAYQLGHDLSLTNLTIDALQTQLDEYVSDRVAFPDNTQYVTAAASAQPIDPSIINITIEIPDDSQAQTLQQLYISNIDSRFGSSVYLHITGSSAGNTILYIKNCQRLRIDQSIPENLSIQLSNCELYYDPIVIDRIRSIRVVDGVYSTMSSIDGLSLWYEIDKTQYADVEEARNAAQVVVDGMTIYQKNVPIEGVDISSFGVNNTNDNLFTLGLNSITLDTYGDVVGCGIAIRNNSTVNVHDGRSAVVSSFNLPMSRCLAYPLTHMTKPISINGQFSLCYPDSSGTVADGTHYVENVSFTLTTKAYTDLDPAPEGAIPCTLFLNMEVFKITPVVYEQSQSQSVSPIGYDIYGVGSDSVHVFSGKVTS